MRASGGCGGGARKCREIALGGDCAHLCTACGHGLCMARAAILARRSPTPLHRHEAHLPAQEAQARPHPRLSRAHEHSRRTHRPEAPPRQGPQAAHRLTVAKRGRLSRSAEFERVYRQGRSTGNRYLVLYTFPRGTSAPAATDAGEGTRVGVSVSRKVGGAVDRNKVKRLLREAFRAEASRLPADVDVVIVARPDALELVEREGLAGVQAAVADLVSRAGGEPT